ncbi:MAG: histone H1, partial [Cytophagales bacterium]|nr:histone H1 [Cytophagales bacterium]
MNRFEEIRDMVLSLEGDFQKFYDKGNQAAGTRVR